MSDPAPPTALTRDQLMQPCSFAPELTKVPGVGMVYIKQISESDRVTQIDMWMRPDGKLDPERKTNGNLRLMQLCVTDADGTPLMKYEELDDWKAKKGTGFVTKLMAAVLVKNGLADTDEDANDLLGK